MSIIPATQEAKAGGSQSKIGKKEKKIVRPYLKNN
jgi:hypothetical protein